MLTPQGNSLRAFLIFNIFRAKNKKNFEVILKTFLYLDQIFYLSIVFKGSSFNIIYFHFLS